MDHFEQIAHFETELNKLIERMRTEYEVSFAEVIGTLHMKAHQLCSEAYREGEPEIDEP